MTHLYFKTKDRAKYISYMETEQEKTSSSPNLISVKKVNILKGASEKLIEEVNTKGLSPKLIDEGELIGQSMQNVIKSDHKLDKLLKNHAEFSDR